MIIDKIAASAGLARFASFVYTSVSTGEVARYTLQLGFNYRGCLEKSRLALEIESPALEGIDAQAAAELVNSIDASLAGTQENYTKADTYANVFDTSGKEVPGVKRNVNDGSLQIFGLLHSKVQIAPPTIERKEVKSRPLTIAKNKIRQGLPIGKFREFALENLSVARINGDTLELA
jgi:hypothetical protein